jgi:hypothetical protein
LCSLCLETIVHPPFVIYLDKTHQTIMLAQWSFEFHFFVGYM